MTITAAIVLYAVIWFMGLFIALPLRMKSQAEAGRVVPGTPASAPDNPRLRAKILWVTLIGTVVWAVICGVIVSGLLTVEDLDFYGRMRAASPD
ncbi:MAG: DUF1467 family protein [Pseudomonadota bacterium]